jgi:aldose sugar dehydrogenase
MKPVGFLRASLLVAVALISSLLVGVAAAGADGSPGSAGASAITSVVAEPVVTGLNSPTSFVIGPTGRFYYVERSTGEVRVFDPADGSNHLVFDLPAARDQFAITLHPSYPSTPFIYVWAKRSTPSGIKDQLLRIRAVDDMGTSFTTLLSLPTGTYHHGARLLFGPDRMLWLTIGDEDVPANSQDLASPAGKLLRMTASGGIPAGNPFANSRVYAYGLRNSFGADFDPATGRLWLSENGPECNDEVDRVVKGRNYGWGPSWTCATPPAPPRNTNQDGPNVMLPKWFWPTTIGTTGAAFCSGCGLGADIEGDLLVGDFNTGSIRALTLSSDRLRITGETPLYVNPQAVIGIEAGSDGSIYFNDFAGIYRLTAT